MSFVSDVIMRYKVQQIIRDRYEYYLTNDDVTKGLQPVLSTVLSIDSLMLHDIIYSIMTETYDGLINMNKMSSWAIHRIISKESDKLYIKWTEVNMLNNERSNSILEDGAVIRLSLFLEKNLFAES